MSQHKQEKLTNYNKKDNRYKYFTGEKEKKKKFSVK